MNIFLRFFVFQNVILCQQKSIPRSLSMTFSVNSRKSWISQVAQKSKSYSRQKAKVSCISFILHLKVFLENFFCGMGLICEMRVIEFIILFVQAILVWLMRVENFKGL